MLCDKPRVSIISEYKIKKIIQGNWMSGELLQSFLTAGSVRCYGKG